MALFKLNIIPSVTLCEGSVWVDIVNIPWIHSNPISLYLVAHSKEHHWGGGGGDFAYL